MARIFITGSADGLGKLAAIELIAKGHEVVLHARNKDRASVAWKNVSAAKDVLVADLSNHEETIGLADKVNALGRFDGIIHNAGVYQAPGKSILSVNVLAPFVLTSLIQTPARLIYLSSGIHRQGDPTLKRLANSEQGISYSDSKFHDLLLAKIIAGRWPDVYANAVDPGWVPTRMGGAGAPGDLKKGYETQVWLATSNDENAKVSGRYFYHKKEDRYLKDADNPGIQQKFIDLCQEFTGISFPSRQ